MDVIVNHKELIEEYLNNRDIVSSSKNTYRCILNSFFRFMVIQGRDATRPMVPDAIAYKAFLITKQSKFTVILYITTIKTFFTWLVSEGKYNKIPTASLKRIAKPTGFTKLPLTPDQLCHLLSNIKTDTLKGKRDYTMILLSYVTGLRTNELANIQLHDISNLNIKVIRKGHRTKDKTIIITEEVKELIDDYITSRLDEETVNDNSFLFVSHAHKINKKLDSKQISMIIKARLIESGINDKRITAHSLRHSTAVNLINDGVELPVIQRYMDHASITTTQVYTKIAEYVMMEKIKPQERLQKLIKR